MSRELSVTMLSWWHKGRRPSHSLPKPHWLCQSSRESCKYGLCMTLHQKILRIDTLPRITLINWSFQCRKIGQCNLKSNKQKKCAVYYGLNPCTSKIHIMAFQKVLLIAHAVGPRKTNWYNTARMANAAAPKRYVYATTNFPSFSSARSQD